MKKIFFKSMLLLCALIVGSNVAWGDTYSKVTSAPSDWSGTYVIIADASNVVFTGQDGSNNYGGYDAVTIKDDAVTDDLSSYEVLVEKSGTSYTIKHIGSSKYLGWSSGNTLAFSTTTPSTNAYKWSLSTSSILNVSDGSRKLQYNSTSPRFACYTSSQKVAYLYKKEEPISVTSLSVKSAPSETRYEVGETLDMTGFVLDADGEDITKGYTMKIGETSISNGSTLSNVGKQTISVSYGGKTVSQNISVGAVTKIEITTPPTKTSYDTGDTFDPTGMVVTASLSTGEQSEPDTWTKEVTGYTIEPDGALTSSDDFILIAYAGKDDAQEITVTDVNVSSVTLKASTTVEKAKTETLIPTILPVNATNKNVTWESDDTDVATVSAAGVVTAVAAGIANITVTTSDGGYQATCIVTVVNKKGSIDAPYSVAEVIAIAPASKDVAAETDVYVEGYIVGGFNSSSNFTTTVSEFQASNLALADSYDETTASKVIPVEMKNGTAIRTKYNPVNNTYKVGSEKVIIKADVIKYFGVPGLKSLDEMNTIAEVIKVGSTGYSTWASDCILDFTGITAIEAYIVTGLDENGYTLDLLKCSGAVPASTGLIIGEGNGTIAEVPVAESASVISTNYLHGCTSDLPITTTTPNYANFYVMVANGDKAEFRNIQNYVEEPNTVTIKAGKAYLDLTGINAAPSLIRIVDEENNATNIDAVKPNDNVIKFFENGQLLIKRDGITYDVVGRIVK